MGFHPDDDSHVDAAEPDRQRKYDCVCADIPHTRRIVYLLSARAA